MLSFLLNDKTTSIGLNIDELSRIFELASCQAKVIYNDWIRIESSSVENFSLEVFIDEKIEEDMVAVITILSSLSLVGGAIGYFAFPTIVASAVKSLINLSENGMVYPLYMDPPFATQSRFYLFDVTNPRKVLQGAEKMKFRLKGPYYYKTYLERDNIMFLDSSQRLKFDSHRKLYAQEEISADFDEKMWLLNPVLPGAVKTVKSLVLDRIPFARFSAPVVFNAANVLFDNFKERLIIRTTPRDYLNGRKVELLESLSDLANRFGLGSLVPPAPPQNVFGLAFIQNETIDPMELYTGVGDSRDKFAEVIKWKDKTRIEVWPGKCGQIKGTNGELYKPWVNTSQSLRVFFAPLCRSFNLIPSETGPSQSENGIMAWEYNFTPKLFAGTRSNPKNKCYCEDPRTYDCQYDGLLFMGPCFFNSPLYFSQANLKGVDRRIRSTTDFLSSMNTKLPDKQTISIEKLTGTVVEVNVTLMGLYKVVKQDNVRDLSRLQNLTYVPGFLDTESVVLPFKYAWQIYMLQKMYDYHGPMMVITALMGAGSLTFRYIFGMPT